MTKVDAPERERERAHTHTQTQDMFDAVLLPLLGVRNFALLAIATPGDEFNHYSQLMDRTDDNGDPLFKTIRLGLVCPECLAKDVRDVCEHRLDLLPPWKSQTNLNRIGKVCVSVSLPRVSHSDVCTTRC